MIYVGVDGDNETFYSNFNNEMGRDNAREGTLDVPYVSYVSYNFYF